MNAWNATSPRARIACTILAGALLSMAIIFHRSAVERALSGEHADAVLAVIVCLTVSLGFCAWHGLLSAQAKAQELISESRRRRAETILLEHCPAGIISYCADGAAIAANRSAAHILGGTVEQLKRQNFRTMESWEHSGLLAAAEVALATGQEQSLDVHFESSFGRELWLSCHLATFEQAGRPQLMLMFTDVSEAKRHELAKARADARLKWQSDTLRLLATEGRDATDLLPLFRRLTERTASALEVGRVSLWRFNAERDSLECADLFEAATQQHTSGFALRVADHPAYFEALQNSDVVSAEDAVNDPRTETFTESYLKPLGIGAMMDARIHVNGAIEGVICHEHLGAARKWTADEIAFAVAAANLVSLALEVAERRRQQEWLQLQSTALEAAANAIVITDATGMIRWVNKAFTSMTGFTAGEAVGETPGLLRSGKQDPAFYRELWLKIQSGNVWRGELINRRKDGSLYSEALTITPVRSNQGAITHFIAVKEDITGRKSLEEQFRQSQKMEAIGRLAGGVAHDFNNMLAVIQGNASLAQFGVSEEDLQNCLIEIAKASDRAASLTRQLLTFSRRQIIQKKSVDLNEVIAAVAKMLRRIIGEDINLEIRAAPRRAAARVDQGMIEQVLLNLAVNARDAMPTGGVICLEAQNLPAADVPSRREWPAAGAVRLSMRDTGSGIAPEHLDRIFEPFFTTKDVGKGSGLGLATVHAIVEQHDGFVEVDTEVGLGTTFHVYLPRIPESELLEAEAPLGGAVSRGTEILLIVEDEEALRSMASRALEHYGYKVLQARNGVAALELWNEHRQSIDLVLTDIVMPEGISGQQLAARLQREQPDLKVIFMSGYPREALVHGLELRPDLNYLQKPFDSNKLAAIVRRTLDANVLFS